MPARYCKRSAINLAESKPLHVASLGKLKRLGAEWLAKQIDKAKEPQ